MTEERRSRVQGPAPRIGVVGVGGGWSTEALADAVEARTGFRAVIELDRVVADLASGQVLRGDLDLGSLDALIVKKVGREYGPDMLDRLELLRFVETRREKATLLVGEEWCDSVFLERKRGAACRL